MKVKKALLVIDMQKGSFQPKDIRFDTTGVISRINDLAAIFRGLDLLVIFIQHDGTKMGEYVRNSREWEVLDDLTQEPGDIFINKYANDVFYNSELGPKLTELNIEELYITGCATNFCVESTIQSALTKDYMITVVGDGHTTGNSPDLEAKQIIDHHNWVWQNMIPTKGRIEVKTAEQIKSLLSNLS